MRIQNVRDNAILEEVVLDSNLKSYMTEAKTKYENGTIIFTVKTCNETDSFENNCHQILITNLSIIKEDLINVINESKNSKRWIIRFIPIHAGIKDDTTILNAFDIEQNKFVSYREYRASIAPRYHYRTGYGYGISFGAINTYYVLNKKLYRIDYRKAIKSMVGDNLDEAFSKLESEYIIQNILPPKSNNNKPKSNILECYGAAPEIQFVPFNEYSSKKFFSVINCQTSIVPRFANAQYITEHKDEILNDLVERVKNHKKFKDIQIPINCFRVATMMLTADKTLLVSFQLKIENEEDIWNA